MTTTAGWGKAFIYLGVVGMAVIGTTETRAQERFQKATFAGGCFWCLEYPFERIDGVKEVTSGYAGGIHANPTYEDVSTGTTGHREAVQVVYDPARVPYEQLLKIFLHQIDPTDDAGQFADRGEQYTTAIFYHDPTQQKEAEEFLMQLAASGKFQKPIAVKVLPFTTFYPAEEHHQNYYKKAPGHYQSYSERSGRKQFINKNWPDKEQAYMKPDNVQLREKLTPLQYRVTQENGTEPPFKNEYWNNKAEGIYVDAVSGEPLFSSRDKFDSGTGWPSFTNPIAPNIITEKEDHGLISTRTEVRSRQADSHLGHVFPDGPAPAGLRYCINSAALRFVPRERLEEEGYGEYRRLFE